MGLLPFCKRTLNFQKPLPERELQLFRVIPTELKSLGDHLRKRRIELRLKHREVAHLVGVNIGTYAHWEGGKFRPAKHLWLRIVQFLGYEPFLSEP